MELWDVNANQSIRTIAESSFPYETFTISPSGKTLATWGGFNGFFSLYNINTGQQYTTITIQDTEYKFSPQSLIASYTDGETQITIWDIVKGEKLITMDVPINTRIKNFNFSPDGNLLISVSLDSNLRFWDVNTGKELFLIENISPYIQPVFSPDGKMIAVVNNDGNVIIWGIPGEGGEKDDTYIITPTVISSCLDSPTQRLEVGKRGIVCTKSDSGRLRESPGIGGKTIGSIKTGTPFDVIDGPECAGNNWSWWQVKLDDGLLGWMAEGGDNIDPYFLCPVD